MMLGVWAKNVFGSSDTVDGRNPAPADSYRHPLVTRFFTGGAGFLPSTHR